LLLGIARDHGGIQPLLDTVFAFFERRTDLFHVLRGEGKMGFPPMVSEQMVLKSFRAAQERYLQRAQPEELAILKDMLKDGTAKTAKLKTAPPPAAPPPATTSKPIETPPVSSQAAAPEDPDSAIGKSRHISTWNGAKTDKYFWSQTLTELTVEIGLDDVCVGKDVKVKFQPHAINVMVKGKVVLDGELHERVNCEESMWNLEDRRKIILTLEKARHTWWNCFLEGDETIDTTKVESTKRIHEYDNETQGAIRKIVFDQNQKAKGEATSDQIRTAEVMRDAWQADNSPFRGQPFDPSLLNLNGPVSEEFLANAQKHKLERAMVEAQLRQNDPELKGTGGTA
jgi:hypothetical protein